MISENYMKRFQFLAGILTEEEILNENNIEKLKGLGFIEKIGNELLEKIWGYDYFGGTRTVDVHIHSLRKIVGDKYILTVRGVGYKFVS